MVPSLDEDKIILLFFGCDLRSSTVSINNYIYSINYIYFYHIFIKLKDF